MIVEEEQNEDTGEVSKQENKPESRELFTAYQNIQLFIVNQEVFISLAEVKHIDIRTIWLSLIL
jgi:hypothetical protein